MKAFIVWLCICNLSYNCLELLNLSHVSYHPFVDYNGFTCKFHIQDTYPSKIHSPFLPYEKNTNFACMAMHLFKNTHLPKSPGRWKNAHVTQILTKMSSLFVETSRKVTAFLIERDRNMNMMLGGGRALLWPRRQEL